MWKEREKACKTTLYGKIKESRGTKSEWLIGMHTQKRTLNVLLL